MKLLSRSESAMQNGQAIETRRVAPSIANREPKLNLNSIPTGVFRPNANANVPTEPSDYPRLEVVTAWVLLAMLVVLSCGALYVLWSKASGGW